MWQNAHDAYMESRILSADPLELIRMLYRACIDSVREARLSLAQGDIAGRSVRITKAHDILTELGGSLDYQQGGELSLRLGQLYDYMQRKLLEANCRQQDLPLSEVLGLLSTLLEGWEEAGLKPLAVPELREDWSLPMNAEPGRACGALSLSF